MQSLLLASLILMFSGWVMANEQVYLPMESGDEITVNQYPATFADEDKPLLIWFTEAYASRKPFRHLITQLNMPISMAHSN